MSARIELSDSNVIPRWDIFCTHGRFFPSNLIGAGSLGAFFFAKTIHFVFDFAGLIFVPKTKFLSLANSWQMFTRDWSPDRLAESNNMSSAKTNAPTKTEWR